MRPEIPRWSEERGNVEQTARHNERELKTTILAGETSNGGQRSRSTPEARPLPWENHPPRPELQGIM